MHSGRLLFLLALLIAGVPSWTSAQQAHGPLEDAAVTYLERNWNRHGLASEADVAELVITDVVTSRRHGRTSVYVHQGVGGIPVIDGQMTVNVDANGHVVHAAGQLISDLPSRAVHSGAGVSPATAANTIASEAGFPAPEPFQVTEVGVGPTSKTTLEAGDFTYAPVTAELVYVVDASGQVRLVWNATVPLHGDDGAWRGLVDASSGEVLRLQDVLDRDEIGTPPERSLSGAEEPLILRNERSVTGMLPSPAAKEGRMEGECYRVFAWPLHDPFHADPAWPGDGRTWECDPFDVVASPGGWHDDGTTIYSITRGNNVHAFPDHDGSDSPNPAEPDGGSNLHFDFPIDFSTEPEKYVDAATTNLFYWNNLAHDVMVHYGFDEAHGNFQQTNFTGDGAGGDYVNANAQDNYDVACNNANFFTPADGSKPRMQMFLGCNHTPKMDGDLDNGVVIHEYGHGISNRMTGGPVNVDCLNNDEQMGEGWSDWYGLMLTQGETASDYGRDASRGVGVFLMHDALPNGFRPAPYNTDFTVNDYTYGDTPSLIVPHGVGFAWTTILWEVTWDLIDAYGFEQDIYNVDALAGNIIVMNLVTEGLALQPCSPGFVDGRDAILEAVDVVYSDQTEEWRRGLKQVMWGAFARRGLGYFADQGSSSQNHDNQEDFTVFSESAPEPVTDLAVTPDGDFVTLTWTAPGDDDSDVFDYDIRSSFEPILTETDWENATDVPGVGRLIPQASGATEELIVTGLDFETEYHFAVKSGDGVNASDLSNDAGTTTLASPVATVPMDPIEVSVPADGTGTDTFTISNAGPSMLRYSLRFNETAEDLQRETIPRPETSEDREVPSREVAEGSPSAGEAQLLDEGGPDAFGYRWIDSNEPTGPTYEWIDISETGIELQLDLDDYAIVDLPFDFPYYENTYDWVAVQSKGSLVFEDALISHINRQIPTAAAPNALIAAYWDDLDPRPINGGAVYYDTLEDGRFVVSWVGVPHHPSQGSFTFQVVLEPGGAVVMQYQDVAPVAEDENSATIGIENIDGTDGLQVVSNAPYVGEELAIRFSPLWVDSHPAGGQIAAGDNVTHTLIFRSGGLASGTYTADMTVTTNEVGDPALRGGAGGQAYMVPIELTIGTIDNEDEALAFEGTHRLSAVTPNPMSGLARTTLEVAGAQDVQIELFDARGRKVATPFEGSLAARTAQEITLDAGTLAPGVYVLKISGESFSETQRFTIVR